MVMGIMANIFIIAYGSLINKNELLNSEVKILTYEPIVLKGFKREFNQEPSWRKSTNENRAVLNVSENKNHFINALLLEVDSASLDFIDNRERGYDRLKVKNSDLTFPYTKNKRNIDKDIFIYLGKKEKQNNLILPNLEYLDICLDGSKSWGEEFYSDFLNTTFVKGESLTLFLK